MNCITQSDHMETSDKNKIRNSIKNEGGGEIGVGDKLYSSKMSR